MNNLADKVLVMIVGPSAIGKSTLMNEVVRQNSEFGRVKSFTTRPPRDNDEPNQYFYLSTDEAKQLQKESKAITYAVYPTTGQIYGTIADSYQFPYNLLDTLSGSVEEYRKLPFKKTVTISLTATPHQWHDWLLERYPEPSEERTKRLLEAKQSINWSLSQTSDHHWVLNEVGKQAETAQLVIKIALGEAEGLEGLRHDAGNILGVIDQLLMTEEKVI